MTARRSFLLLAALAVLLAAGFALREARTASAGRAAERALQSRRDELTARLRAAQRGWREEQRSPQALEQPAGPARAPAAAPAAHDLPYTTTDGIRSAWFAAHPEARSRYLQAFRAGLSATWGLLFQSLNLSSDQVEKLKDLLAQREDNDITVAAAEEAKGLDESAPEIQALDDQLDSANKAALKELLGKTDYAAVRNYMHDEEVIPIVDQLAGSVYPSSSPLTGEEAMALTQALADSSQKKESGRVVANTVNWEQAMPRVQSILSPDQFAAFADIQQKAQASGQLSQLMLPVVKEAMPSLHSPVPANPVP